MGPGFSYHAGAAVGSLMPVLIGAMQDRGAALPNAITPGIAATLLLCVEMIWLGRKHAAATSMKPDASTFAPRRNYAGDALGLRGSYGSAAEGE